MKSYLGIDPGQKGAACLLLIGNHDFRRYMFLDWSDPKNVYDQISKWPIRSIEMAILEKVNARPGMAAKAMFSFGKNTGHWEMILHVLDIPFQMIVPTSWQKGLIVKSDGSDSKKRAEVVANRLFPALKPRLYGPKGGIKDGRIDALLMAEKARRMSQ